MNFKVGDRVRCVDDGGKAILANGRLYTVEVVEGEYVRVNCGSKAMMFARRFERVSGSRRDKLLLLEKS